MSNFEEELEPHESNALRELAREKAPPGFLEQRTVDALARHRLIRSSRDIWRRRALIIGAAAAASVLLFVAGALLGGWRESAPTNQKPEFILVLRNSPRELPARSADDKLSRVREYGAWARKMNERGLVLDGEKLTDEVRTLNVIDGRPTISEIEAEAKGTAIAGFFLIHARDYQEAIAIAEDCPHAKYGGTIEIRKIDSPGDRSN
jgi:hypothetical protein